MGKFDEFETKKLVFDEGCYCTYNGVLWPILESMKAKIKDEHHNIVLITGRTGTGKTEFAFQIAKYLNKNFCLDDVYWTTDDLIRVATNDSDIKPPGTVFIFDEAREGTQSLNAMSETNRRMGLFLDTIRSRRYHILLLQPSFWLFQRNIAVYSADLLFHIEKKGNNAFIDQLKEGAEGSSITEKPFHRGYARVYDNDQKLRLYVKGKQLEDMNCATSTLFRFDKSHGIIDWAEYTRKKNAAVAKMNSNFTENASVALSAKAESIMKVKSKAWNLLIDRYGWTTHMIAEYFGDSNNNVNVILSKSKKDKD